MAARFHGKDLILVNKLDYSDGISTAFRTLSSLVPASADSNIEKPLDFTPTAAQVDP